MSFYIGISFLSVGLALVSDLFRKLSTKKNIFKWFAVVFFVASAIPLFWVKAFRYGLGTDYFYTYVPQFERAEIGAKTVFEPLYDIIVQILAKTTHDPASLFILDAGICIALLWVSIAVSCRYVALPVFIFSCGYDFFKSLCFERQYLAMSICILAFSLLLKYSKYILSSLLILLAVSIHTSAISILLIVPIYYLSKKIKSNHQLYMAAPLFVLLLIPISYLIKYFYANSRYRAYTDTAFESQSEFGWALTGLNIIVLIILFLVLAYSTRETYPTKINKIYFVILVQLVTLVFSLLQGVVPLIYRVIWYFDFLQIVSVPYVLSFIKNKNSENALFKMCVILAFCGVYGYLGLFYWLPQDSIHIIPFRSIFG